ncbi:MAG: DUF6528 family protein [Saprospiraceae bacterium]|nr:DUF6528 family protein [Saprospiraceae bacterium]
MVKIIRQSTSLVLLFWLPIMAWSQSHEELIACGDNQVLIFDVAQSKDTVPQMIWHWKANEAVDLPNEYRTQYFQSMDECKPLLNGTQLLLTSSSGGVALIDRASKKALFYAVVGNAHSAELLPNGRIAVMASTHDQGNRIVLFNINKPESPIFYDSIYSGHGVVWDEENELLYTLGYDELRAYQLMNWHSTSPSLERQRSWKIPGASGHDLSPWPKDQNKLILTEHGSVWSFDKLTGNFATFEPLAGRQDVKAVSLHPTTNRIAFIQAETSWWSHRIYLQNPDQWFSFPDIKLYKVRWLP